MLYGFLVSGKKWPGRRRQAYKVYLDCTLELQLTIYPIHFKMFSHVLFLDYISIKCTDMSEQTSVYINLAWEHLLLADTRLTSDIN